MIEEKFVDLYAKNSGVRDKLVAERDIVLTYALRALLDDGVMRYLAFKGGTCLRKLVFGSSGRFSEDLDFTLDTDRPDDDVLIELVAVFNAEHHGIRFIFDDYYKTDGDTSFGGDVLYRHAWNDAGRFRLQVSLRERPTLPVVEAAMQHQGYFDQLEFDVFELRSLDVVEMIAEKVRAAYQRVKVRDLYDLNRLRRRRSTVRRYAGSPSSNYGRRATPSIPRSCSKRSTGVSTTGTTSGGWCEDPSESSQQKSSPTWKAGSPSCARCLSSSKRSSPTP